ncbi:hypothetical protein RV10_GL002319 [Enterococcus pallens]|nr:hypothetical protein RV10_GL002319 [Enterococcus pallens]
MEELLRIYLRDEVKLLIMKKRLTAHNQMKWDVIRKFI